MKVLNSIAVICCISFIVSCKNANEKTQKNQATFPPAYTQTMQIVSGDKGDSYFIKRKSGRDHIVLQIPIPKNSKYQFYKAYNLMPKSSGNIKAIAVHISDKTDNLICGEKPEDFLPVLIPLSSIVPYNMVDTLTLDKGDSLKVFVFNENIDTMSPDELNNALNIFQGRAKNPGYDFKCDKWKNHPVRPKESGGGVIIEGP